MMGKIGSCFRKLSKRSVTWLVLAVLFYILGAVFAPSETSRFSGQLSYMDIYEMSISMLFVGLFLGLWFCKDYPPKGMVFSNFIVGFILVFATTEESIASTILFWLGVVSACFAMITDEDR